MKRSRFEKKNGYFYKVIVVILKARHLIRIPIYLGQVSQKM